MHQLLKSVLSCARNLAFLDYAFPALFVFGRKVTTKKKCATKFSIIDDYTCFDIKRHQFAAELRDVRVSAFLLDSRFADSRQRLVTFLSELPEGATTTTNFGALHKLAKFLQIPNEMTDFPGGINDVGANELVAGALAYIFRIDEFQHRTGAVKSCFPNLT